MLDNIFNTDIHISLLTGRRKKFSKILSLKRKYFWSGQLHSLARPKVLALRTTGNRLQPKFELTHF